MAHVIIAHWRTKPGEDDYVGQKLAEIAPQARQEPNTLAFYPQRSTDDPRVFVMYERYTSPAAFDEHCSTELFKTVVDGDLTPRLESSEVTAFTSFAD